MRKIDIIYYTLVSVLSMIVFLSALVLSMGYYMYAPTWWERYIEIPIYMIISVTIFVVSVYRALKM